MQLLEVCNDLGTLSTILFIKNLISILCKVTPVVLVLVLTIDFVIGTIKGDKEKTEGIVVRAAKRIIFAVAIFFIPTIVNAFMDFVGEKTNYSDCYNRANAEIVEQLAAEARELDKLRQQYTEAQLREILAQKEENKKRIEELRKRAIKLQNSDNIPENASVENIYNKETITGPKSIAVTAEALAWDHQPGQHSYSSCKKKWPSLAGKKPTKLFQIAYDKEEKKHFKKCNGSSESIGASIGASCDVFVSIAIRYSGYDTEMPLYAGQQMKYFKSKKGKKKWKQVSKAKPGDVCIRLKKEHVMIYIGGGKVAQAQNEHKRFGHVKERSCNGFTIFRAIG